MLINMKRLIQGIHVVGDAIRSSGRAMALTEGGAAGKPGKSPDLSGFAASGDSSPLAALLGPKYAVLAMAKAALAALVSWGVDDALDRISATGLGLQKLPANIAIGHRGCVCVWIECKNHPAAPATLPSAWSVHSPALEDGTNGRRPRGTLTIHTPGHLPAGTELTVSSAQTSQRLLAMVALTNALRLLPGLETTCNEVMTHYCMLFPTVPNLNFIVPSLVDLAQYWQDIMRTF